MRKSQNLTQEALAEQMGLKDKSYVSKIENVANEVKISTLKKYVEALNVTKMSIKIEMESGYPEELVLI
jgi:transcriptional regulator with XRE-family HTH domain